MVIYRDKRNLDDIHSNSSKGWYLLQIKPNSSNIAKLNLQRQSFEVFFPHIEVSSKILKSSANSIVPLFPGYMFVAFDAVSRPCSWKKINNTFGVSKIINFGRKFQPIRTKDMVSLMKRCDDNGKLHKLKNPKIGDDISILYGPFEDFVGTIEKIDSVKRVCILIELLGRKTSVMLDIDQILNT
jgi:transcriptional antiterminator RfaH